jgi:hypothetical protein
MGRMVVLLPVSTLCTRDTQLSESSINTEHWILRASITNKQVLIEQLQGHKKALEDKVSVRAVEEERLKADLAVLRGHVTSLRERIAGQVSRLICLYATYAYAMLCMQECTWCAEVCFRSYAE